MTIQNKTLTLGNKNKLVIYIGTLNLKMYTNLKIYIFIHSHIGTYIRLIVIIQNI